MNCLLLCLARYICSPKEIESWFNMNTVCNKVSQLGSVLAYCYPTVNNKDTIRALPKMTTCEFLVVCIFCRPSVKCKQWVGLHWLNWSLQYWLISLLQKQLCLQAWWCIVWQYCNGTSEQANSVKKIILLWLSRQWGKGWKNN